jgi:hypothetical protein
MGAANALAGYFRARGLGEIDIDRLGNVIVTLRGDRPAKRFYSTGIWTPSPSSTRSSGRIRRFRLLWKEKSSSGGAQAT